MPTKLNSAGQQQPYDSEGKFASMEGGSSEKKSPVEKSFINDDTKQFLLKAFKGEEKLAMTRSKSVEELQENLKNLTVEIDGKVYSYGDTAVKEFLAEARRRGDEFETYYINTPERQQAREQWIKDEFASQQADRPIKKERKATFVFGNAASGKSSVSDPLKKEMGAYEIDADLFKQRIPEFQEDVLNIRSVHEESSDLSKRFMAKGIEEGANLVIGKVGGDGNWNSIQKLYNQLSQAGYEVEIICVDMPEEQALINNLGRFKKRQLHPNPKKPARIVDPSSTIETGRTYLNTLAKMVKLGQVKNWKIYDGVNKKYIASSDE